jgi:hypothetical protein
MKTSRKTFGIAVVMLGCCTRLMAQDKQREPFLGIAQIPSIDFFFGTHRTAFGSNAVLYALTH